jgi:hypothetical protein
MSTNDIESELSYAYLHAVAAMAGMSVQPGTRHDDNDGVDATLTYLGPTDHPYFTRVSLAIQLKATVAATGNLPYHHSYFLQGTKRYNKLRKKDSPNAKFLVVLFLPDDHTQWLTCTSEQLVLKKAAYWVNLYGAEESDNETGVTVYLPKGNVLTPDSLLKLVNCAVTDTIPPYKKP